MAEHVLYVATHGPQDPTRATLVFAAAIRMRESKGLPVKVALLGKGVELLKQTVAKKVKVTGRRPPHKSIHEMMIAARKAGVEIHCWQPCYEALGIKREAVEKAGFVNMTSEQFADLSLEARQVISF